MRRCAIFVSVFLVSFWAASVALAMGDNVIGQVLDQVQQRISDTWDWIWDPLWRWYFYAFLIFLACLVIGYFLPFKWTRAFLGGVLALTVAFVAGGRQMRQTYKNRLEEERAKRQALEAERRQRQQEHQQNGSGGGSGPFGDWFRWR